MPPGNDDTLIGWLPWSADAFARAAREDKPVLLSLSAAWCRACHEMDRTTYADGEVASLIQDHFVPVRVDTDRRPDINERYNLGGWPTTAFLTPEGDLITGGTFVPADRMCGVLSRVASAFASGFGGTRPIAVESSASALGFGETRVMDLDVEAVIESIFSTFDEAHGGFGIEPKFPHTAPLHLAMALYRETEAGRWRHMVERTLDAMADGGLWDATAGGFYRYSSTRDWQLPHTEKLLDTNADLLGAYAEAALVFDRPVDRERCAAMAAFITGVLRADGGGYRGSDADRILYMAGNAAAASALLGAATVLDDGPLGQEALASFERVILLCYKPGAGVAHYSDGAPRVRGLLADQVATIGALLDAHDVSGAEPYKMMAEELAHVTVRELWDADGVGFFDRAGQDADIGLLRMRRKPFVANAEAASVFARLDRLTGLSDPSGFRGRAEGALRAASEQMSGHGPLAAHYVLALRQLSIPVID